jgi:hypothetical protein
MYTPYQDGHIFTDPPGSHQKGQKRTVEVNHDPNNKGQAILFTYTFFFPLSCCFFESLQGVVHLQSLSPSDNCIYNWSVKMGNKEKIFYALQRCFR